MIVLLLALAFGQPQTCTSTIFAYHGDKHAGGASRYLGRRVAPTDVGIAHRRLRLGTKVQVCVRRNGRCAVGVVLDRGPYGMRDHLGWFNARGDNSQRARGKALIRKVGKRRAYRGCADLTPGLATLVNHNGLETVTVTALRTK